MFSPYNVELLLEMTKSMVHPGRNLLVPPLTSVQIHQVLPAYSYIESSILSAVYNWLMLASCRSVFAFKARLVSQEQQ